MSSQQDVNSQMKQIEVKVILVGDTSVGKTCIASRYITNKFTIETSPTSGTAFMRKTIVVNNTTVKFMLWDTAGQENYRSMVAMYYRNAAAAIVVFDLTRASTFEVLQQWVEEIRSKNVRETDIYIVGNKLDKDGRQIDRQQAEEYASKINAQYFECSAMDGTGIEEIFNHIAKHQINQKPPEPTMALKKSLEGKDSKSGCC